MNIKVLLILVVIVFAAFLFTRTVHEQFPCCKGCPECTCNKFGPFRRYYRRNCPCPNCIYNKMSLVDLNKYL